MYATINIANRVIDVKYCYIGKECPETRETPATHPELLIEGFWQGNKNITDLINRYCDRYNYMETIESYIKYL